jgi:hypothetical protein
MNRKVLVSLSVILLLSAGALSAQVRTNKPNDFTIGLGGQCLIYNLAYQRVLTPNFALEAAVSYIGGGSSDDAVSAFFLSGGARLYMLTKDATPYIAGGVVWATADTDAGPFDGQGGFYGYVSPGFEYRSSGGFVLRGGVYFILANGGFVVWPGISLGVAF